eukprot:14277004-Alexandrium_andersonii.AAC.1
MTWRMGDDDLFGEGQKVAPAPPGVQGQHKAVTAASGKRPQKRPASRPPARERKDCLCSKSNVKEASLALSRKSGFYTIAHTCAAYAVLDASNTTHARRWASCRLALRRLVAFLRQAF